MYTKDPLSNPIMPCTNGLILCLYATATTILLKLDRFSSDLKSLSNDENTLWLQDIMGSADAVFNNTLLLDFIRRYFRSHEEFSSAELHLFNRILSA